MIDSLRALPTGYVVAMGLWLLAGLVALWVLLTLRRRWKDRPRRRRFVHALLSLWMLLTLLTGVELYFAVLYDESDSFNMTNVSKKWFDRHIEPFQRQLVLPDGQGTKYRDDRPFPEAVGEGQRHVCFVGDSFAFGHGVPQVADRFSNRVRAALEQRDGGRFVVSNLAQPGTELHWVEALIEALLRSEHRVDTFVYVVCLNDIETFHPRHATFYQDFGIHYPRFFLLTDSYFFNLLYFRLVQHTVPEIRSYYTFVKEYYTGPPWDGMRAKIEDIAAMCRQHDAEFRVVIFPFLHNLGPAYPFREAHQQIATASREAGIPVLDLEPVLAPHVDEGLTVNRFDAHPNERAHALAAQAIETWLVENLEE